MKTTNFVLFLLAQWLLFYLIFVELIKLDRKGLLFNSTNPRANVENPQIDPKVQGQNINLASCQCEDRLNKIAKEPENSCSVELQNLKSTDEQQVVKPSGNQQCNQINLNQQLDLKRSENQKALNEEWSKKIDQIKELKDSECRTKLFESKLQIQNQCSQKLSQKTAANSVKTDTKCTCDQGEWKDKFLSLNTQKDSECNVKLQTVKTKLQNECVTGTNSKILEEKSKLENEYKAITDNLSQKYKAECDTKIIQTKTTLTESCKIEKQTESVKCKTYYEAQISKLQQEKPSATGSCQGSSILEEENAKLKKKIEVMDKVSKKKCGQQLANGIKEHCKF